MVLPLRVALASPSTQLLTQHPPHRHVVEVSGLPDAERTATIVATLHHLLSSFRTVAWVQPQDGPLLPADLARNGLEPDAIAIVEVPRRAGSLPLCRAAELVLRSGAFDVVIVDLCDTSPDDWPAAWCVQLQASTSQQNGHVVLLRPAPTPEASPERLPPLKRSPQLSTRRFWVSSVASRTKTPAWEAPAEQQQRGLLDVC